MSVQLEVNYPNLNPNGIKVSRKRKREDENEVQNVKKMRFDPAFTPPENDPKNSTFLSRNNIVNLSRRTKLIHPPSVSKKSTRKDLVWESISARRKVKVIDRVQSKVTISKKKRNDPEFHPPKNDSKNRTFLSKDNILNYERTRKQVKKNDEMIKVKEPSVDHSIPEEIVVDLNSESESNFSFDALSNGMMMDWVDAIIQADEVLQDGTQ